MGTLASISTNVFTHSAAGLTNKRTNDFLRFDLRRNVWKTEEIKAEDYIPSERDFHASVLHSNYFYIIGGSEKRCKLNEIHRIKIKDEMPGRSIHRDLERLLGVLFEEHAFSDFRMVFREKDGKDLTIYSYKALVEKRLGGVLEKLRGKGRCSAFFKAILEFMELFCLSLLQ